jgi:hypothetical protein
MTFHRTCCSSCLDLSSYMLSNMIKKLLAASYFPCRSVPLMVPAGHSWSLLVTPGLLVCNHGFLEPSLGNPSPLLASIQGTACLVLKGRAFNRKLVLHKHFSTAAPLCPVCSVPLTGLMGNVPAEAAPVLNGVCVDPGVGGPKYDVVSRFFAPWCGIPEDPVCTFPSHYLLTLCLSFSHFRC